MDPTPAPSGKWADLRTRLLSAIVMVAVGSVEIWLGGLAFAALVVVLTGVMIFWGFNAVSRALLGRWHAVESKPLD